MSSDLDELIRVVGTMPREMAREVLNFARHLQTKHGPSADDPADWDDFGSPFGADPAFGSYHPWDTAEVPGVKDVA